MIKGFESVTMIGAGGVAWSLAQALAGVMKIDRVYSRSIEHATAITDMTGGIPVDDPSMIKPGSSLYVVAIADHATESVLQHIPASPESIWVTTSGSLPQEILSDKSHHYGVFYPLQTFTRSLTVKFQNVPLFIEGSSPQITSALMRLGQCMSNYVHEADASTRLKLHIAGVLTCNFVNHLWDTADRLLASEGLTLDVVRPLIAQSFAKIAAMRPFDAQTGPARRGDIDVMKAHLSVLSPEDAELYRLISNRILKLYNVNDEPHQL